MAKKLDIELAEAISEAAEKRLVKAYKQSLKDIRAEVSKIYAQYSTGGVIHWKDMIRNDGQLLNRYETMFQNIMGTLKKNYKPVYNEMQKAVGDTFKEGYYKRAYDIQAGVGKELSFTLSDPNVIKQAVMNPISGLTLKGIAAKDSARIIENISTGITRGLVQGASINEIDKIVKVALGEAANNSQRIVRTEALRAFSLGQLESEKEAEELGIRFIKKWSSTKDGRTRPSHVAMDGVKANKAGMFTLRIGENAGAQAPEPRMFGIASEDIQCRCVTVTDVAGFEDESKIEKKKDFGFKSYSEYREAQE